MHIFKHTLILTLFLLPAVTFAGPIVRSGDVVSVEADQVLGGDFYGAGGTVVLSGNAEGDVYVIGGSVTQNAPVNEDLVVVGGTVQVHGPVLDDLRIVAGEATLAEKVSGDVVVLGGAVNILSTAEIEGDLLLLAGEVTINGRVGGSVAGVADTIRIDAGIGGTVDVTANKSLTLGSRAEVQGNVLYKSPQEMARAQDAVVVGEVVQQAFELPREGTRYAFLPTLTILFAALIALLMFKRQLQHIVTATESSYARHGLIGLGVLFGGPLLIALLIVSMLGFIPALALLFLYMLLLLIAWITSGIVLGSMVMRAFKKGTEVTLMSTLVGIVTMSLIVLVPIVGIFVAFAIFLVVLGSITKLLYKAI